MDALKVILTVAYLIICVAIVFIVMVQDTNSQGLGAALAGGNANNGSYWSKNKGRSKEGMLNKVTIFLALLFIVLSVVLSLSVFQS
ncbi:MAG: preprotein translocase subunit SecG [Lachnospiraceae bacterium]|nr:preprotein translocase subunit SecG [Lachnospiraceae bacterium]